MDPKLEIKKAITVEKKSLDFFVISGDLEKIKNIGIIICTELQSDSMVREADKKSFFDGEKQRPGGVFAVYLSNGKLFIQNINGVGIKQYQDQLEKAVTTALK